MKNIVKKNALTSISMIRYWAGVAVSLSGFLLKLSIFIIQGCCTKKWGRVLLEVRVRAKNLIVHNQRYNEGVMIFGFSANSNEIKFVQ